MSEGGFETITLDVDVDAKVATLTLNRPEKLNALNYEIVEQLHGSLDAIGANNDCRVVVITGAGRGFCSGLDLADPNPARRAAARSSRGRACAGRNASQTSPRGYTVLGSR
jgi:enoyl-CoA hydratase/carnithine racemase